MKQRTLRARWIAAAAGMVFLAAPAHVGATKDFTTGAALIGINILYVPAKLIYAAAGGIVAGAAYAVSGGDAAVVDNVMAMYTRAFGLELVGQENQREGNALEY